MREHALDRVWLACHDVRWLRRVRLGAALLAIGLLVVLALPPLSGVVASHIETPPWPQTLGETVRPGAAWQVWVRVSIFSGYAPSMIILLGLVLLASSEHTRVFPRQAWVRRLAACGLIWLSAYALVFLSRGGISSPPATLIVFSPLGFLGELLFFWLTLMTLTLTVLILRLAARPRLARCGAGLWWLMWLLTPVGLAATAVSTVIGLSSPRPEVPVAFAYPVPTTSSEAAQAGYLILDEHGSLTLASTAPADLLARFDDFETRRQQHESWLRSWVNLHQKISPPIEAALTTGHVLLASFAVAVWATLHGAVRQQRRLTQSMQEPVQRVSGP
ncbi:MAG: hypothetical protein AB1716_00285 [Planctomycetota bacterium]